VLTNSVVSASTTSVAARSVTVSPQTAHGCSPLRGRFGTSASVG
jgi:hypothetical protein